MQTHIDFTTASPINQDKLKGQNKTIFTHLSTVGSITVFDAITKYGVYHLHSRISDLRNKCGIAIYDRMVNRGGVSCKEYSLTPFQSTAA